MLITWAYSCGVRVGYYHAEFVVLVYQMGRQGSDTSLGSGPGQDLLITAWLNGLMG